MLHRNYTITKEEIIGLDKFVRTHKGSLYTKDDFLRS
jgi:hypothetical protein